MSEIYLIRHGESAANIGNATASNELTPLTDRGHAQAEKLARDFRSANLRPDAIVVSPLARALATAAPFLSDNISVTICRDFREFSYLASMPHSTYAERANARNHFWSHAIDNFDFRDAASSESLNDFYTRAQTALDFLTHFAPGCRKLTVFVFSHEMFIAALLSIIQQIPRQQFLHKLAAARQAEPPIKHTQVAKLILANSTLKIIDKNLFDV